MKKNNPIDSLCPVCSQSMSSGYQPWHFICLYCGYEQGWLQSNCDSLNHSPNINETHREIGLKALRQYNFKIISEAIVHHKPQGGKLLEAGSAHGWFLELARKRFDVLGIEPDRSILQVSEIETREGYFPLALKTNELFDVIVFNDVFEHLPKPNEILTHCKEHLKPDGLLVLNLPSSKGIFYLLAGLFCRAGYPALFERLWQKNFPSPHLHYFNPSNLIKLLSNHEFKMIDKRNLSTLRLNGLNERITHVSGFNRIMKILIYLGASISLPFLKIMPRDTMCFIFRKKK